MVVSGQLTPHSLAWVAYLQRRDQVCGLKKGQLADLVDDAGDFGVAGCSSSVGRLPSPRLDIPTPVALCGDAS